MKTGIYKTLISVLLLSVLLVSCAAPAAPMATVVWVEPTSAQVGTEAPAATEAAEPVMAVEEPQALPAETDIVVEPSAVPTELPAPASVDLKVTGLVAQEVGWSTAQLKAMPATKASGKSGQGSSQSYTGVLIAELLKLVVLKAEAKTLVFIGDSKVEVLLADMQACTNCIVTFRNQGGFSLLIPSYSEQLALKGLKEIQVK